MSVATIVLLLVVVLVMLLAPQIAWLVGANEFDDPLLTGVAVRLMRMAAPTILFLGIASVLTGALFALKRFNVPAFIGAIFNGTIVVVALLRRARARRKRTASRGFAIHPAAPTTNQAGSR